MKSAYQYLIEILYLVGESRSKLPALILLFLFSSILDLLGLGLIAPYVSLIMNFENQNIDWIGNKIIALGLPMEQEFILIWMGVLLITVFLFCEDVGPGDLLQCPQYAGYLIGRQAE